jgi:hypothetical protein
VPKVGLNLAEMAKSPTDLLRLSGEDEEEKEKEKKKKKKICSLVKMSA